jgi:hypothetical protein
MPHGRWQCRQNEGGSPATGVRGESNTAIRMVQRELSDSLRIARILPWDRPFVGDQGW